MSKARQADCFWWRFMGGVAYYPYQVAFGVSLRYWPCLYAPSVRVHVGPLKVWLGINLSPSPGRRGERD